MNSEGPARYWGMGSARDGELVFYCTERLDWNNKDTSDKEEVTLEEQHRAGRVYCTEGAGAQLATVCGKL